MTATVRLARAILRLNSRPFPAAFNPVAIEMFRTLGTQAGGAIGWVYRNIGLTRLVLLPWVSRLGAEMNAIVRTTQAVTTLEAGGTLNALAESASATVDLRVAVGTTVEQVVRHVVRAIDDESVRVEVLQGVEAAPISPVSGFAWELLRSTIEKTCAGTLVAPYVHNGATDSRHFARISTAVYRFTPFEMTRDERATLHARNERMHVATYVRGIEFYRALLAAL
jgi:carboxypeptidase PM20D1